MRLAKGKWLFGAVVFMSAVLAAAQHKVSDLKPNPGFDKVKTLAGQWEGMANEGGQKFPASAKVTVVSDRSAVMHDLAPGTPHEMITMFHLDGPDLLATHYCAAHNQPRMKLVPGSDPNVLLFEFKDGTNIAPGDIHMQSVKIIFVDADHHYEDWTSNDNGQLTTMRFDFHRKKA